MNFGQEPTATSLTCVTTGIVSQPSSTLPPAKFAAGMAESHCTVTGAGQVRSGGRVSTTVRVTMLLVTLPPSLVTMTE